MRRPTRHSLAGLAAGLAIAGSTVLVSTFAFPVSRAEAQAFWNEAPSKKRKQKARPASSENSRKADRKAEEAQRKAVGPLVINVSLNRQRLTVYDANGPIAESPVSSGRIGFPTPTGVFSVVQKRRQHFSNLYAGASMPNMQRLTWSGVALHAGQLPGYPASHGCIRLPHGFSSKLFGMTQMGTRVIVSRDPVEPVAITHERLFDAYPSDEDLAKAGIIPRSTRLADASHATGSAQDAVTAVLGVSTAAAASETTDVSPAQAARQRFLARRQAEEAALQGELRTAGYERASRLAELEMAQAAAEAARGPYVAARDEAERIGAALADLEAMKADAERELAILTAPADEADGKRKKKQKREVDASKRIAKIQALEVKLGRLPGEIEVAREDWTSADAAAKAKETAATETAAKRREALDAFKKADEIYAVAVAKEAVVRKLEAKRSQPISIFISRAKQRLYVRLGYEDIFDVPVTFERPDDAIGTHVFTALAFSKEGAGVTWSVASVPHDPSRTKAKQASRDKKKDKAAPPVLSVDLASQTAAAALDRITIPDETREQISDLMKPGSSIVISDFALSNETGKYTDFIGQLR